MGYSLALNHPFLDGNKRVAHAAMEVFLILNGFEIIADADEQERLMLEGPLRTGFKTEPGNREEGHRLQSGREVQAFVPATAQMVAFLPQQRF